MTQRIWDPNNKYPGGLIKEYNYWVWEVSYRQHTLGSFILFSKIRAKLLSQLPDKAMVSLAEAMKDIESTMNRIPQFNPDHYNYWQMGNATPHLHIHGFPRYQSPRYFAGKKWVDETWGDVPIWSRKDVNSKLVGLIATTIKSFLGQV